MTTQLFFDDRLATDELDGVSGIEISQRLESAGYWRFGGVIAAHRVQRDSRQGSDFLRLDCLPAGVEPALGTNPMRAFHRATLRTFLENDCGRFLVRVAGALLPL
jgi:hypothetical protein